MVEETFRTELRRQVVEAGKAPEAAHHFVLTRVGDEVLLEVGFVDLTAVALTMRGKESDELTLYVTHRFSLSRQGLDRLFQAVDEIRESVSVGGAQTSEGPANASS